jgi:hypothetical protein
MVSLVETNLSLLLRNFINLTLPVAKLMPFFQHGSCNLIALRPDKIAD